MTPIQHHHVVSASGEQSLTVFPANETPIIVTGDHPRFDEILASARSGGDPAELRSLADVTSIVDTRFRYLSERVTTANGLLYFDGDELDSSLTQHILRLLKNDRDDYWPAFVAFLENLALNPSKLARTQLYDWLAARPFSITAGGDLVGYKGLVEDENEDVAAYRSVYNGPAVVNGVPYDPEQGYGVPQDIGDTVEMARSTVDPDSYVECAQGLHVGTYDFGRGYGNILVRVIVNPRDVVGVPSGITHSEKFRCCRYYLEGIATDESDEPTYIIPTNE